MEELHKLLHNFSVIEDAMDEWVWCGTASGVFSVKSAYEDLSRRSDGLTQ